MTHRREIAVVYGAGLVQGLALVTFPAASLVLTSPDQYGLSSAAYGVMFLPQAVTALSGSLLGARLSQRVGMKRVFTWGLGANVLAMATLVASQVAMGETSGYLMLLGATASLGLGFGLTVPTLNTFAGEYYPARVDRAVLLLNALLGLGTALAPIVAAIFLEMGAWWGLPVVVGALLLAVLTISLPLPLVVGGPDTGTTPRRTGARGLPSRFWVYAGFALLYGAVETIYGTWGTVYMGSTLGASATAATLALAAFWSMVTVGRVLFAAIERRVPETVTYRVLPLVAAGALLITAQLPHGSMVLGVLVFGVAGLGCSALLPLTISFGEQELTVMATAVTGSLFAFYQVGYGLTAFGVGPLEGTGIALGAIYAGAAGLALLMAAFAFIVVRGRPVVATPLMDRGPSITREDRP